MRFLSRFRVLCISSIALVFLSYPAVATYYGNGGGHSGSPGWFSSYETPISYGRPVKASVGTAIELDPVDAFSLSDPGPYFYAWELVSRPSGSAATLSDPGALRPMLTPDIDGEYEAELTVGIASRWSGRVWSHEIDRLLTERFRRLQKVRIKISTDNVEPVAQIRFLGSAIQGQIAELSGATSFDADGDAIDYSWRLLDAPIDSQVSTQLADQATQPEISLTPDVKGVYQLELVVTDSRGNSSAPETLSFEADNGVAPVASVPVNEIDAAIGTETILDAFSSTDVDGDRLSASWRLIYAPTGSIAKIVGQSDRRIALTPDTSGDYLIQLRVKDTAGKSSTDHVLVSASSNGNLRPTARIAPVAVSAPGTPVELDGAQSYDLNGDLLSYQWSVLSAPSSSISTIDGVGPRPSFTPDLSGDYVLQLIVSDGSVNSIPTTVIVSTDAVRSIASAGPDQVPSPDGTASLDGLGSSAFGGDPLSYDWSILGLAGADNGQQTKLSDDDTVSPTLTLGREAVPFFKAVRSSIVYKNRDPVAGGADLDLCRLDVRSSPLLTAEETPDNPFRPRLYPRGFIWDSNGAKRQVWTVKNNKMGANSSVRLQAADGSWSETIELAGGVNATLSTPHTFFNPVKFFVDGVFRGVSFGKFKPFLKRDPVCSGLSASVIQLEVKDQSGTSVPDTVVIGDIGLRPLVSPGATIGGVVGEELTLIGSSFAIDANADDLTYRWALISRPEGSLTELAGGPLIQADQVSVTTDRAGVYLVQLVARDNALDSEPIVVVIDVSNEAPTADAGPDQQVFVGETATFDGSGSIDPDGDPLLFSWSIVARPAGSTATLANSSGALPSLIPDRRGTYAVQLIVSDGTGASAPDTTTLTVPNRTPVAAALPVDEGFVGQVLTLDASGSTDPDNDPLTFAWQIVSAPAGSTASLAGQTDPLASFIPDLEGDYEVLVTASDGLLTAQESLSFSTTRQNTPPSLETVLDLSVVSGTTLTIQLVGTDVDPGDPLTYFASPLPLPAGMAIDALTGVLTFTPNDTQVGEFQITLGVSDSISTDAQLVTFTVEPRDPADATILAGRVLDAEDFDLGIETPIVDATVTLESAGQIAQTDATGSFAFTLTQGGRDSVTVETALSGPGGFTTETRFIEIVDNVTNQIDDPFLLGRVGNDCVVIDPLVQTVLESSALGVSLTFPAGSVKAEDGSDYTGQICLGTLPQRSQPPQMPEEINACQIYSLDAPGASFDARIQVSVPNLDGLPEGATLGLWALSPEAGRFIQAGRGEVSPDGNVVSTQSGVPDPTLFTFVPTRPTSSTSVDQPTGLFQSSPMTGDYRFTYQLPGFLALNEPVKFALSYHSASADPTAIVASDVTISANSGLPQRIDGRLTIGGLDFEQLVSWNPREAQDGSVPALIGEEVTLTNAAPVDVSGLPSGAYAYELSSRAEYDCSSVATTSRGEISVQNEIESPYGAGWAVDGLQRIVENSDGGLTVVTNGLTTVFDPEPTITSFAESLSFSALGVSGLATGDFDGNGEIDIAYADNSAGAIRFIYNFGARDLRQDFEVDVAPPLTDIEEQIAATGTFSPAISDVTELSVGFRPLPALMYTDQINGRIGFIRNDGFGDFANVISESSGRYFDVTTGDLDGVAGENFEDVAAVGALPGFFSQPTQTVYALYLDENNAVNQDFEFLESGGDNNFQIEAADFDLDGFDDLVLRSSSRALILWNNQNRSFSRGPSVGSNGLFFLGDFVAIGNVAGDERPDIVWSSQTDIQIFEALPGRQFASAVVLTVPPTQTPGQPIAVFDTDADGNDDIVLSNNPEIVVFMGDGEGGFEPPEVAELGHFFVRTKIVDIDQDGSPDLVSQDNRTVYVDFSDPSASGKLIATAGEFSSLERTDDGGWVRRYLEGTEVFFDPDGRQIADVDTNGNRTEYTYDDQGRLSTITDEAGGISSFSYGAGGFLQSVMDPSGRTTFFVHDERGNLVEIEEAEDGALTFEYDEERRLTALTTQRGFTTTHDYGFAGRYAGSTFADGSSIRAEIGASFGLDGLLDGLGDPDDPLTYISPDERVTRVTDKRGGETVVTLNEYGGAVRIVDPLGRVSTMERDANNLVTRYERPTAAADGSTSYVETFTYDERGNVLTRTEGVGTSDERTTRFEYEPVLNRVTKVIDPDGFETVYEYDPNGNRTREIDPEGGERLMTYDPRGLMISSTDKNGNVTLFAYDTLGNVNRVETADTSVTFMEYDGRGNVTLVDEAINGGPIRRQQIYEYDAENRMTEATDGLGNVTSYTYDSYYNVTSITDPTNLTVTMTYDALGRLATSQSPTTGLTTYVYDIASQLQSVTDAEGNTTSYTYDAVDRITSITDANLDTKQIEYDVADNVSKVIDATNGETVYGYDVLDRMISRTDPINLTRAYSYDGRDNLITLTREDGVGETAIYDGLSRRTRITTPDNTYIYGYDPQSNMVLAADDDSRCTMTYDEMNRVASEITDGTVGPQPAATLAYSYDLLSRRQTLTDQLGGTISYQFDQDDRLVGLTRPWGGTIAMGYDDEDRRTLIQRPNGAATSATYDIGRRLGNLEHIFGTNPIRRYGHGYSPVGRLDEARDLEDLTRSRSIGYDPVYRVTQTARGIPASQGGVPIPVEDFAYNGEGDRTVSHLSLGHEVNAHHQLLGDDSYIYTYDAKGNRTTRTDRSTGEVETYTYDSVNNLISVTSTDGLSVTYAYDALFRRIAKDATRRDGSREAKAYIYDGQGTSADILLEYDISGTEPQLFRRWLHGAYTDEPLAFEQYNGTTGAGTGAAHELHADRQGSIIAVVDQTLGEVLSAYEYDAFGGRDVLSETLETPYGFQGREIDAETGLYYYRARYMDPNTGQFIASDPIGFTAGDTNTYAYTWNDPYTWSDPSGLNAAAELMLDSLEIPTVGGGRAAQAIFATAGACLGGVIVSALNTYGDWLDAQMANPGSVVSPTLTTQSIGAAVQNGCAAMGALAIAGRPYINRCGAGRGGRGRGGRLRGGGRGALIVGALAGAAYYLGGSSFAEGTVVMTEEGPVAIEDIRAGDMVLARHEATGELAYAEVLGLMGRTAHGVLRVTLEEEGGERSTLSVTAEHPFFVAGKGWTEAGEIEAGDILRDADLDALTVVSVEADETPQTVHNLEVAEAHTYFAGDLEAWAHNRTTIPRGGHGRNRHCTCSSYPSKSKYKKPAQRAKLVSKTLSNPDSVTESAGRIVYRRQFGRAVGRCGETSVVVVQRKRSGNLVTDYPSWR